MNGICYNNTKTTLPNWVEDLHVSQPYGYAYETNTHFVHIYGKKELFIISVGLTVTEKKNETLINWVEKTFGAENIKSLKIEVGHTISGVWRPSLYYNDDIFDGLKIEGHEKYSSQQGLKILIQRLDELLLYIEPSENGLKSYSHKSRELILLACTEVENHWGALLKRAAINPQNGKSFTTNDYVRVNGACHLKDFSVKLRNYPNINVFSPFDNWSASNPTQSLAWYDAYNKTKHDRDLNFSLATLLNCIYAVTANIVMCCVRFGPFNLFNGDGMLSAYLNENFDINVINCDITTFYIPRIELPPDTRNDLLVYDCYRSKHNKNWVINDLIL